MTVDEVRKLSRSWSEAIQQHHADGDGQVRSGERERAQGLRVAFCERLERAAKAQATKTEGA